MKIGILALQGAFAEHEASLDKLHIPHFEIRQADDLQDDMDGLIIPGGESTVMGKLLKELSLYEPLKAKIEAGLPVFGTCAGLLLLAKDIDGEDALGFRTMNIVARRNAYGRQLGSFFAEEEFKGIGTVGMTFIRAPYIESVGDGVDVLATCDGKIVAARQGKQLVTAFHPELTEEVKIHQYFVDMISENLAKPRKYPFFKGSFLMPFL